MIWESGLGTLISILCWNISLNFDYKEAKIGKKESEGCRLACSNTIAGHATVRTL